MIYPIQRLHIAVQDGTGIEYTPEDAQVLLKEICAMESEWQRRGDLINELQDRITEAKKKLTNHCTQSESVIKGLVE